MKYQTLMKVILVSWLTFLKGHASQEYAVADYHKVFVPAYTEDKKLTIAIRSFYRSDELHFLVVNPDSMDTAIVPAKNLHYRFPEAPEDTAVHYFKLEDLNNTPYLKTLNNCFAADYKLLNYGITHSLFNQKGHFLTIDMCPSSKHFEKRMFDELVNLSRVARKPVAIALCISGLWIEGHAEEFAWLKQQQADGYFDITWVNHSFSHPYYSDLKLEDNFLNFRIDNFEQEILDTEKALLQNGITPSVFFRFPGLCGQEKLLNKLKEFALIPLGADAWLADNEKVQPGSIILVHGNGNEKKSAIDDLLKMLPTLNIMPLTHAILKDIEKSFSIK